MRDIEKERWERLHRVAVGKICGCKSCICCRELAKHRVMTRIRYRRLKQTGVGNKMKLDLFKWASGHLLTEHLPDNYEKMSDEELWDFCKKYAWGPFEHTDPSMYVEYIDCLAQDIAHLLRKFNIVVDDSLKAEIP